MKTKKFHIPIYEFDLVVFEMESKEDGEQLKRNMKSIGIPVESIKDELTHIKENYKNGGCTLYDKEHNLLCIILQPFTNDRNWRNTISVAFGIREREDLSSPPFHIPDVVAVISFRPSSSLFLFRNS